ncbi:hypothetical protein HPP92_017289 [Vanilla planifolia]|uniref:Uncharacterized protein n=1 Tax=Vanilla planifolia TaxID=51239 RepID=A0A835Q7R0_VANPL|nr:hypothetical protein HPP92_017280 [Vanilla planifolia]KAG0467961.1 hypothetical protein HPP92_017289 [Vanilla planifolia]
MAVHRKIQRWMENKENTQTGGADPGGTDRKNGEDSSSGTLGRHFGTSLSQTRVMFVDQYIH